MRILVLVTLCGAAALAIPARAQTQFAFRRIALPGATSVNATALNGRGTVVGNDTDAAGEHGFILNGTDVTLLPNTAPGCAEAITVYPTAINQAGAIAGAEKCSVSVSTFLYANSAYVQAGSFDMGPGTGDLFVALNTAGKMAFNYYAGSGNYAPYAGKPPDFRQLSPNGAGAMVVSLNNAGVPAGAAYEGCGIDGGCVFVGGHGGFTNIYPPGAMNAAGGVVNDAGQVAGTYSSSPSGAYAGFVYANGAYTVFTTPGRADSMSVLGINTSGRVVGVYAANGKPQYGFLYNGSMVTKFGVFPAGDRIGMAINGRGEILVSDTAGNTSISYRVHCAGPGC